ncbi:MAG TPA: carboxylesterase family protein [Candidatus Acidoferrum sp.]|nr:carboxylesterase family protein [Candidatus Acidoferrum sp.]
MVRPRAVLAALCFTVGFCLFTGRTAVAQNAPEVKTESGPIRGKASADGKVNVFLGIPFAAPPVGPLRWKPPQPPAAWTEVRNTTEYGAHCMQAGFFKVVLSGPGQSEDCLTLNVWAPAGKDVSKLPVMVWIYGGGFVDGGSSEPVTNGENLAKRGVVLVSMNYRLNVFGFFATHELAEESPQHAAGNYGLMDQAAALNWVKNNIALFGGDPAKVTIFGESAGAFAVSGLMASPLTKGLIAGAIGESGGGVGRASIIFVDLATKEKEDEKFAKSAYHADNLAALRAMSADDLAAKSAPKLIGGGHFTPNIDGYVFTEPLPATFAAGKQAKVPLLAGWNADETSFESAAKIPNYGPQNLNMTLVQKFGFHAGEAQKVFPATNNAEAVKAADDLSAIEFLVYGTWAWLEAQVKTGNSPVYRYQFDLGVPAGTGGLSGAFHSDEVAYVFGNLDARQGTKWRPEDYALSEKMQNYWTNFAKSGDPNGNGLPGWPKYGTDGWQVIHLDANVTVRPDEHRERFLFLQKYWNK